MSVDDDGGYSQGAGTASGTRQRMVPRLRDLHDTVLRLLPEPRDDTPYRVLDLGTGTGTLIEKLLNRVSGARVHMVQSEQVNLDTAKDRLAGFADQVTYELSDYVRMDLNGPYDVVISEVAASFLENKSKRTVLSAAYAALRRGGRYIGIIQARGATERLEAHYVEEWEREAREQGALDADFANTLVTSAKDRTATLAQQLDWIAADGFEDVDCFVKYWRFAVVVGDKV